MIGRIILTLLVIMVCFASIQIVNQKLAPNKADDLAIKQINEDGSRELLRAEQISRNWYNPFIVLIGFLLMFLIWKNPVEKFLSYYRKKKNSKTVAPTLHSNG